MEICIVTTVKRVTKKMATIMDEQLHWHHSSQHTGTICAWAPATHCQQCRTSSPPDCDMPVFRTLTRSAQLYKKSYATTSLCATLGLKQVWATPNCIGFKYAGQHSKLKPSWQSILFPIALLMFWH